MKVVVTAGGTAAIQASPDDLLPRRGVLQKDLIALIARTYAFNIAPAIPPGMPTQPVLAFQSGWLAQQSGDIPIAAVHVFPDGLAVTAADTDVADRVVDDLMSHLDSDLKYRFSEAPQRRLYASALVAEFESGFPETLAAFRSLLDILNEAAHRPGPPFSLKRLAFSQGPPTELMAVPSVLQTVPPDFVIEPRVGTASTDLLRWFCGAPVRTAEHVALLERMERIGTAPP